VAGRVEGVVVDTHDEGGISTPGWSRHNHARCASVEMAGGVLSGGEPSGGFHHHVDAELGPWQGFHLVLGRQKDAMTAHNHDIAIDGDGAIESAVDRVAGQEPGQ
jgi:hypothetical protein